MSHEISTVNGVAEMFSGNNQTPWHGLGQVVEGLLNSVDAIKAAHLGWTVSLQDIFTKNGTIAKINGWKAVVRDDTHSPLGIVKSRYTPIQNVECFDFLDSLAGDGKIKYETAGALRGGRHIWICAKIDKDIDINGDKHNRYLLAVNSHDQTYPLMVMWVTVRVVCANTLSMAFGTKKNVYKMRHTTNWKDKADMARTMLELGNQNFDAMRESLEAFGKVAVTPDAAAEFTKLLFPARDKDGKAIADLDAEASAQTMGFRSTVQRLFNRPEAGTQGATRWDMFNAVTDFADHFQRVGKTGSRIESALLPGGNGTLLKDRAYNILSSDAIMEGLLNRTLKSNATPVRIMDDEFARLLSK